MDLESRPKVLLVESDKESPQPHASLLMQKSYSVITATEVSEALSMIINENSFDCVLVDAQLHGLNLVEFLQAIWKHYPHLPIVAMTSSHAHMKLVVENLADHSIYVLKKPCDVSHVCNILQHVCQMSLTSSSNISKHGQSMMECKDKGKHPMKVRKKKNKTCTLWTSTLHAKFMEAIAALGKRAYPTPILKHMNIPGLTRSQVASHLQRFQEKEKAALATWQRENNLQVESSIQSTASDHNLKMTSTNSIGISHMRLNNIQARLSQRVPWSESSITNSSINQQIVLPLAGNHFQPPITDNYMSNAFGCLDEANKDYFSEQFEPLTGGTSVIRSDQVMESQYCMEIGGNSFSNGFVNPNFVGGGSCDGSESLAPLAWHGEGNGISSLDIVNFALFDQENKQFFGDGFQPLTAATSVISHDQVMESQYCIEMGGSCAVREFLAPLASHDQGNGESSLDVLDLILFDQENNHLFCDEFEQLTGSTTVTTDQVMEPHVYSMETYADGFYNTYSVAAGISAGSESGVAQVDCFGSGVHHQILQGNGEASLDVEENNKGILMM